MLPFPPQCVLLNSKTTNKKQVPVRWACLVLQFYLSCYQLCFSDSNAVFVTIVLPPAVQDCLAILGVCVCVCPYGIYGHLFSIVGGCRLLLAGIFILLLQIHEYRWFFHLLVSIFPFSFKLSLSIGVLLL